METLRYKIVWDSDIKYLEERVNDLISDEEDIGDWRPSGSVFVCGDGFAQPMIFVVEN